MCPLAGDALAFRLGRDRDRLLGVAGKASFLYALEAAGIVFHAPVRIVASGTFDVAVW